MLIINSPQQASLQIAQYKSQSKSVALVPTMGSLHRGHLSLIKIAQEHADVVVVSIFVNPMQFGENEDFTTYPRTLKADTNKLKEIGVDLLFTPTAQQIYPQGANNSTQIIVPRLAHIFCGKFRPQFFIGVASLVAKLFNILPADYAVFGRKDYQQLLVIKQMVADLSLTTKILSGATIRAADGLALSSRNNYLTVDERKIAVNLYDNLVMAKLQVLEQKAVNEIELLSINNLTKLGFKVDYFRILTADLTASTPARIIICAVWLGTTRLIDNIIINDDE